MATTNHAEMSREARRRLIATAADSVRYVARGSVMPRELAEEYGLPVKEVETILLAIQLNLCDAIDRL